MPEKKLLNPSELFMENYNFIGENYFIHLFNEIPSKMSYFNCSIYFLMEDLKATDFTPELIWEWELTDNEKGVNNDMQFYNLGRQILMKTEVTFQQEKVVVYFPASKKAIVEEELCGIIKKGMIGNNNKAVVKMLAKTDWGLGFETFEFDPVSIKRTNYNADFWKFDAHLSKHLADSSGGLVLLHGDPGTGKTSYLMHQCATLKSKNFIYIPPNMAQSISDPNLILLMKDEKDAVLIIEDAEQILVSRSNENSAAVSNLLNLTDGFLSKCFDLTVICTFNCRLNEIDRALLRKGRLKGRYEFGRLSGQALSDKAKELGLENISDTPMTLADLYNLQSEDWNSNIWSDSENKIGFSA